MLGLGWVATVYQSVSGLITSIVRPFAVADAPMDWDPSSLTLKLGPGRGLDTGGRYCVICAVRTAASSRFGSPL